VTEFQYEEHVPRQRAAERLADIAYALAGGDTLELRHQGGHVSVPVADEVLLIRRSTAKGGRIEVDVTLSWSSPTLPHRAS
jgi:amphi-Trp domain-containing protein